MELSKMTKDQIEELSYTEIAKLYLEENQKTMNTAELFKAVCTLLSLSENDYQNKITDFFQSLTTSKDFILLPDGTWDLKKKHSVKVVMEEIYEESSIEEDEEYELEDEDEITEEDEYNSIDDEDDYAEDDLSDLTILNEDELDSEE